MVGTVQVKPGERLGSGDYSPRKVFRTTPSRTSENALLGHSEHCCYQVSLLLSSIIAVIKYHCCYQVSLLLSSIIAVIKYHCCYQVSLLLSSIIVLSRSVDPLNWKKIVSMLR